MPRFRASWGILGSACASFILAAPEAKSSPARASGFAEPDTIPPVIVSGRVLYDPNDPARTCRLEMLFSEPIEALSAILFSNYIDVNTGQIALQGFYFPPNRVQVRFAPNDFYGFGSCEQVRVINVEDLSGNEIVDDGVGNVVTFYLYEVLFRGRMDAHMSVHDTPPHSFSLEGNLAPLTFSPFCDVNLQDADGDSSWVKKVFFCLPCSTATAGPVAADVEFKLAHQCGELEPLAENRSYSIDLASHASGRDTLDLFWNDDIPANFTARDLDVVFRVRASEGFPPFQPGDSLGVAGSELPLAWDATPSILADDGVLPDGAANDGLFTTRLTFPSGTWRDLEFKYLLKTVSESAFAFECIGSANRSVFLDDAIYSTSNPLVSDVAYFDDCLGVTGAGFWGGRSNFVLEPARPNPLRSWTRLAWSLPEDAHTTLDIFDLRGRLVRRLIDAAGAPGRHEVQWNGQNASGETLPAGIYFVRLRSGAREEARKILLAR